MDKKLWFPGGEPNISANDLNRDAEALFESFFDIFEGFTAGSNLNFIIAGCQLTVTPGVEASVTPGFIWLNGEVLKVEAQTTAFSVSDVYCFEKQTTYDPNGQKIFNNGVTRDTWEVNRGILVNSTTDPVATNKLDARGNRMTGKILEVIRGKWVEVNAGSAILTPDDNFIKLGINGSGTWTITIPDASEPTITPNANFINILEQTPGTAKGTFEIREPDGTLIKTITEPEFIIIVNDSGTWKELWRLPTNTMTQPPKIVDIGAWNMDDNSSISIPHGLPSKESIWRVTVRIFNDDQNQIFDFSSDEGGEISWTDSNIELERAGGGGTFNNTDFDNGVINRGQIYINHF